MHSRWLVLVANTELQKFLSPPDVEITHLGGEKIISISGDQVSAFSRRIISTWVIKFINEWCGLLPFFPSLLILYKSYQVSEAHLYFSWFPHDWGWCRAGWLQIICLPGLELISPALLRLRALYHWGGRISLGGQMWTAFLLLSPLYRQSNTLEFLHFRTAAMRRTALTTRGPGSWWPRPAPRPSQRRRPARWTSWPTSSRSSSTSTRN